jgi:hypothetical protein
LQNWQPRRSHPEEKFVVGQRLSQAIAVLGAASAIGACSSPPQATPSATSVIAAPSPSESPASIPARPVPGAPPVILNKQIGESAHMGCPDVTEGQCDVDFVITSIESEVPCIVGDPIDADQQLVRINIDVTTSQQFLYPDTSPAGLYWNRWGIGDDKGVVPELQPYFSNDDACMSDQGLNKLLPGTHMDVSWLVKAPKLATKLRLYNSDLGDGWIWDVPRTAG